MEVLGKNMPYMAVCIYVSGQPYVRGLQLSTCKNAALQPYPSSFHQFWDQNKQFHKSRKLRSAWCFFRIRPIWCLRMVWKPLFKPYTDWAKSSLVLMKNKYLSQDRAEKWLWEPGKFSYRSPPPQCCMHTAHHCPFCYSISCTCWPWLHCPPLPLLLLHLMQLLALITLPTTAPPSTRPQATAGLDHTAHHCPSCYSTSCKCWPRAHCPPLPLLLLDLLLRPALS